MPDLRVVTYNVQQMIGSDSPRERAVHLLDYLSRKGLASASGVDIFVLQEAFLASFQKQLRKSDLADSYQIILPRPCVLLDSGVCILFKKSIGMLVDISQETYSFATSVDQLASKGFIHVQVTHGDGTKSHIVGTHTQAQYGNSSRQLIATLVQLAQLSHYLFEKIPRNESIILAGDLNILKKQGVAAIGPRILEYLMHPLHVHSLEGNSYDPQENPLARKTDPKGVSGQLDYLVSNHYGMNSCQVLKDAYYQKGKVKKAISDHDPVQGLLQKQGSEARTHSTSGSAKTKEHEEIIRALFAAVLLHESTQTGLFGFLWNAKYAEKIVGAMCTLAEGKLPEDYQQAVVEKEKQNKTVDMGERVFLKHCVAYLRKTVKSKEFSALYTLAVQYDTGGYLGTLGMLSASMACQGSYAPVALYLVCLDNNTLAYIQRLLQITKAIVYDDRWNIMGKNIFFRGTKCPAGIKALRLALKEIEVGKTTMDNKQQSAKFLGIIHTIHHVLAKKTADCAGVKASCYRNGKTQKIYEALADVYKKLSEWEYEENPFVKRGVGLKEATREALVEQLETTSLQQWQEVPSANLSSQHPSLLVCRR